MSWEIVDLTREDLYQLVWEQPIQKIAKRFNVSDVALGKACRRLGVPVPGRGFWARKAAGYKTRTLPLPPAKAGQNGGYRARGWTDPNTEPPAAIATERAEDLVVPEDLSEPHALIAAALPHLRQAKEEREDLLQREACVCIVAQTQVAKNRAIRTMDTLLKALEKNGWAVGVTEPKPGHTDSYGRPTVVPSVTFARAEATELKFGIYECADRVATTPQRRAGIFNTYVPRPDFKSVPNGRLSLRIDSYHWGQGPMSWTDGKRQRVEGCLQKFLVASARIREGDRVQQLRRTEEERLRNEARLLAWEAERVRKAEAARVADLKGRIDSWKEARQIAALADAIEREAREGDPESPDEPRDQWLAWARTRAASLKARALSFKKPEPEA